MKGCGFVAVPVCPLLVMLVFAGSTSKPTIFNGGNCVGCTVNEFILIGLWCFPAHVLYCSPQWDGPVYIVNIRTNRNNRNLVMFYWVFFSFNENYLCLHRIQNLDHKFCEILKNKCWFILIFIKIYFSNNFC